MDPADADRHWRFYELTLDEVRSQVEGGWAHTQFFIVLNAGIIGAILALLGSGGARSVAVVALIGGAVLCLAGALVLRENKRYYRRLALKRAALERHLGLDRNIPGTTHPALIYALTPTADAPKIERMLRDPDSYAEPKLRRGSVSDWARWTLAVMGVFDVVTALALLLRWV